MGVSIRSTEKEVRFQNSINQSIKSQLREAHNMNGDNDCFSLQILNQNWSPTSLFIKTRRDSLRNQVAVEVAFRDLDTRHLN